ncbi:MAG TPA: TonB-dependent receptor [Vicinamibacterales bacterium]|nr:TonB-dependent receptor [Vicinamibacterales bacterium]
MVLQLVIVAMFGAGTQGVATTPCALSGRVVDETGTPLPGATVTSGTGGAPAVTDRDGRYCLVSLPDGRRTVTIAAGGFLPVTFTLGADVPRPHVRDATLLLGFSSDVVVTGTRTAQGLESAPVRTEVIGRDAIRASGARTLADAMEFTTGVRVENNCQNCNFSQIRLLGLDGPYTQILVDSQPVISSLAQVYGIEQIPARMIERIEVVKGGGSALYGAGAVGGVVNIISREAARSGGLFEARAENGGALNGAVDWVSGDRMTFLTAFGQRDQVRARDVDNDGFTDVSRRDLSASGVRLNRYALDGRGRVTADMTHLREARRGGDQIDRPPHEAEIAESIDSRRTSLSASWYHGVSARWDYRVTVAGADTARDSYYGTGRDPNAYGETTNALALADVQVNVYARPHTVSIGGQVSRDHTVDRQPAYGRAFDEAYVSRGLFVQDDWTIRPGMQLLTGLRVDAHSALDRPIWSPRAALLLSPAEPLDIRVSAASGFRAPQVFDEDLHLSSVGGDVRVIHLDGDLREERATSLMAGVEWKPTAWRGQALVEVNVFHTRLTDLFHIIDDDDPLTSPFEVRKTNLGGARVYGVEINLGWGIGDALVVQGGVVTQRATFDEPEPDFGSRSFFRTPERYGNATIRWSPAAWELFAGLRATGSMVAPHYAGFIATDRLERTRAFVTLDASLGRRFAAGRQSLVVTVAARNLTNAFQPDLDRGPLRDASYVYGPRFPRSIGVLTRVEF